MKVTLKQISETSNYSLSTVSRALNSSHLINQATREKIQKIALDMGYYDNALEINSKIKDTYSTAKKTFGLIFMDISNPITSAITSGIEDYFATYDVNLIIANSRNSIAAEANNILAFNDMDVDGIIILPVDEFSHQSIEKINIKNTPIIYLCHQYKPDEVDFVCIDSYEATYKSTEYLINLGHRDICFIGSYPKIRNREKGFIKALSDYNIPFSDENIYRCLPNYDNGYKSMESIILGKKNFTAVVGGNDFIAMGVMDCANKYGYSIPEDFSIVGFDNIVFCGYKSINLTTVNQNAYDIGKHAAEILSDKIYNNNLNKQYSILESSFIIRESCKSVSL